MRVNINIMNTNMNTKNQIKKILNKIGKLNTSIITAAKIDFAVGGQAVIEGVMMRSPNFYTVSVRDPQGNIRFESHAFKSLTKRYRILNIPFVRGIVHLTESMVIGFRALNYSNAVFLDEDGKGAVTKSDKGSSDGESSEKEMSEKKAGKENSGTKVEAKFEDAKERGLAMKILMGFLGFIYVLATLAFSLFLLKFLPLWIAEKAANFWPFVEEHYLVFNAIDGATKITIFISYIILISLMKDIRRVFEYHGAEHKSIWAYEAGLELNTKNAAKQSRFHPRCGTSFIFIVILMSILVYTAFPPADSFWMKLVDRLAVLPLIAGLSYELLKLSAKFQKNILVRIFIAPGLWIQKLTTREPDESQLEIALHSLKESLKVESELVKSKLSE